MRMWIWFVVATLATACGDNNSIETHDSSTADSGQMKVERGRYVMNNLAACTFCHTPLNPDGSRDLTRLFAGVDCLVSDPAHGIGCINSRNLTNDATGLLNASDAQIKYAIKSGYRTDGKPLAPLMPYAIFHNMNDDDVDAIVAYLRTVPGVNHTVAPNEMPWSLYNDGLVPPAKFLDPAKIPMPGAAFTGDTASAMRGRYLSSMAGLCIDCHTPTDAMMVELDQTKFYTGGRIFARDQLGLPPNGYPAMITSRNITSDSATGVGDYSIDQLKAAIADGKDPMGNAVCAATHGSVISPYAALLPQDLTDIATYVKSLAAVSNNTGTNCAGPPVP